MKSKKVLYLANIFNYFRISKISFFLTKLFTRKHIRIINYHKTPLEHKENFEAQLRHLLKQYHPVNLSDLIEFLENGTYKYKKPGIIFTFDDGFKSNYNILSLLEKYEIKGFFFISPNLVGLEEKEGSLFCKEKYMEWNEIREVSKKHIVGSHTLNHVRMRSNLSKSSMKKEIIESKKILEKELGKNIEIFCWVGGEVDTYSPIAEEIIRKNYKYIFRINCRPITKKTSPFLLERTNIEINWPNYLIDFYLSGFVDIVYLLKRRKLAKNYEDYSKS